MSQTEASFRHPLIVVYGRDILPDLVEEMIKVIIPDALVVQPKNIPPSSLPEFCKENGGPSLVIFTNELMSGARATDVMLELRELGIHTLLMTDEITDPKAQKLGICTVPKICRLGEFQVHLQLALSAQSV